MAQRGFLAGLGQQTVVVGVAQLVEHWIVTPEVAGSNPVAHPIYTAKVAELVDALALGASGVTRESSSLSFRTITP